MYGSVEELRAYLEQTDEDDEPLLGQILERATSIVDGALGFSFGPYPSSASTKTVRGSYASTLRLPPHEPGSVTLITLDGETVEAEAYEELESGLVYLVSGCSWGTSQYVVTAKWGYGPAPESIVEVTLEIAVNIWRSKDKGLFTELIGAEGGGGIRYIGGLTRQQQEIIRAVKRKYAGVPSL